MRGFSRNSDYVNNHIEGEYYGKSQNRSSLWERFHDFRDRQTRQAGGRCCRRPGGRHGGAGLGMRFKKDAGRHRLVPVDRRVPGKDVFRRPYPGRVLQTRRKALGERDPRLSSHRQAHPSALPGGSAQRRPGGGDRPFERRRRRPGHAGIERRLVGAWHIADPVRGAYRGLPRGAR